VVHFLKHERGREREMRKQRVWEGDRERGGISRRVEKKQEEGEERKERERVGVSERE
jgi:hypothetical protein